MQLNSISSGVGSVLVGLLLLGAAIATGPGFWSDDAIGNFIANGPGRVLLGVGGVALLIYGGIEIARGDKAS